MSAKSTFDALCGQGSGKQNRSTIRENDASYETDLESKQAAVNAKMKISTKSCLRRPKRLRRRCLKRSDSMHAVAELEVENDFLKAQEAHLRARGAWLRQHINEVYGLNATFIAQRDALHEHNRQIIDGRVRHMLMMETLSSGREGCQWHLVMML